jgi:hypothetical protein
MAGAVARKYDWRRMAHYAHLRKPWDRHLGNRLHRLARVERAIKDTAGSCQ